MNEQRNKNIKFCKQNSEMTKPKLEVFFETVYLWDFYTCSINSMFFIGQGTRSMGQITHLNNSSIYHSFFVLNIFSIYFCV